MRANPREQGQIKGLTEPVSWPAIVSVLEKAKGEPWERFRGRHGDWGRDAALWLGRGRGRLRLARLGQLADGMDYTAVGQAVSRFGKRLEREAKLRRELAGMEAQLSHVEI